MLNPLSPLSWIRKMMHDMFRAIMPSTHQATENLTKKPYFYLYLIKVQKSGPSKETLTHEKKVKICDWATLAGVTSNRENHASKKALP